MDLSQDSSTAGSAYIGISLNWPGFTAVPIKCYIKLMKVRGKAERIKWDYFELVEFPDRFKPFLWEYGNKAHLEMVIYRVLYYGSFGDVLEVYRRWPEQTYRIALKYPDLHRGVKFWVRRWYLREGRRTEKDD